MSVCARCAAVSPFPIGLSVIDSAPSIFPADDDTMINGMPCKRLSVSWSTGVYIVLVFFFIIRWPTEGKSTTIDRVRHRINEPHRILPGFPGSIKERHRNGKRLSERREGMNEDRVVMATSGGATTYCGHHWSNSLKTKRRAIRTGPTPVAQTSISDPFLEQDLVCFCIFLLVPDPVNWIVSYFTESYGLLLDVRHQM